MPELKNELAKFPIVLRVLIETELAAGNSIIEVGHSFPAPPAGAYVKLANKVSTRARADGDGLSFKERCSSIISGEFTDAQRCYFVIEPPNLPPVEPDMSAIRKTYEPHTAFSQINSRIIRSTALEREAPPANEPNVEWDSSQALSIEESATGATRILHFRDKQPPHEVQFELERGMRTLFTPSMDDGKLCLRAKANVVGADYNFLLRFEAALPVRNCYSLRADVSWGELPSDHADYYRETSGSWFATWTRDFVAASRPLANEGSAERYRQLCEEALNVEKHLDSVAAIQQAIIAAMKDGARFCDPHKEGGTHIFWNYDHFVRSDYGDYPDERHFTDEIEFLRMLYQFCHFDAIRLNVMDQLSEIDTWRLILRRMNLPKSASY